MIAMSPTRLSRRAQSIKPSPTLVMNQRAAALVRAGRNVIALSLGEPDFHTPEHVKDAGIAAIRANQTKYTAADGTHELKNALATKFKRDNGLEYPANQVVVGSGAKIILLAALLSTIDPGDDVVIPAPYWVSYPDLVEVAGGKPVIATCPEATGFKLTGAILDRALSPRTRALILNSPNNPTGAVYTAEDWREIASVLARYPDVWVITDELYEHLVYNNHRAISFAHAAPEVAERVITVNGLSKGYVMTGWRIGFAGGPNHAITVMADLLSQMHGSPNTISQAAALAALDGDQSFIDRNRETFCQRRDLVVDRINRLPHLSTVRPCGAFYVFVNCAAMLEWASPYGRLLRNDIDVSEALIDEAGVAVVPGTVFGMSPYFRISYALDLAVLEEAMGRIAAFATAVH